MLTTLALAFLTSFPQPTFTQQKPAATQAAPLAAERRELAEIQLLLGADRKYAEAKERLATLKETLAKRTDSDAKTLAAEVERLDQTVRRALGEAVPASANVGEDKVDEAVLAAIQREDFLFVKQLGKRAVPGLLRAVRENADAYPSDEQKDPLFVLCQIDALAASQLAGELLNESGFFWKKRVARLLRPDLCGQPGLWSASARWLGEGLTMTAEKLVDDADVGRLALEFLGSMARQRGTRSPVFDAAMARALHSEDGVRREAAMDWSRRNAETVGRATFVTLLGEDELDLREFAARVLTEAFPQDRSLLTKADDPSMSVRFFVADWLLRMVNADWQAEERAALARLLKDADAQVRAKAREALFALPVQEHTVVFDSDERFGQQEEKTTRKLFRSPLPDEVYRALLAGDASERTGLTKLAWNLPAPLCFELLEALAGDRDPRIIGEFAESPWAVPLLEDPKAGLRVIEIALDNPSLPNRRKIHDVLGGMFSTRSSLRALLSWLLERDDDELVRGIFAGRPSRLDSMSALEPELVTAFLARYFEAVPAVVGTVENGELQWSPEFASALLKLAGDAAAPLQLRVLALRASLGRVEGGDVHRQAALAILKAPAWRDWATTQEAAKSLQKLINRYSRPLANTVILAALHDEALPAELQTLLANGLVAEGEGAAEIVKLVLLHWPGEESWYWPTRNALRAMGKLPAAQDPEFLARAVHDPRLTEDAFRTLGLLGDPRYLPLLADSVARPSSMQELGLAASALTGYLDEGAVEPLLAAAAKVQSTELRDQILAHLEKIREYQDSKARWATRKVKTQTREQVIAELVAQLSAKSDDVKVQALRALATWDAVETMPRLIELTSSGSKSVAAAAREALERLNAPKKD